MRRCREATTEDPKAKHYVNILMSSVEYTTFIQLMRIMRPVAEQRLLMKSESKEVGGSGKGSKSAKDDDDEEGAGPGSGSPSRQAEGKDSLGDDEDDDRAGAKAGGGDDKGSK